MITYAKMKQKRKLTKWSSFVLFLITSCFFTSCCLYCLGYVLTSGDEPVKHHFDPDGQTTSPFNAVSSWDFNFSLLEPVDVLGAGHWMIFLKIVPQGTVGTVSTHKGGAWIIVFVSMSIKVMQHQIFLHFHFLQFHSCGSKFQLSRYHVASFRFVSATFLLE